MSYDPEFKRKMLIAFLDQIKELCLNELDEGEEEELIKDPFVTIQEWIDHLLGTFRTKGMEEYYEFLTEPYEVKMSQEENDDDQAV